MQSEHTKSPAELPCSEMAEQIVLGCLIEDEALLPGVLDSGLTAADFMISNHRRVFQAILDLRQQDYPVDYVAIAEHLGNKADDFALLGSLIHGVVVDAGHALHHARIVKKKAQLRELMKVSAWLEDVASTSTTDPELLVNMAIEKLQEVRL
jgi:replicative DNA helicase